MTDRWQRVDALYHQMLALEPDQRATALAAACPGDDSLAAEVQSLLDQPDSVAGFLARPVQEVAARLVSDSPSLLTGQRIGVFEVKDLIGVGGMGEVYRARDTRLGRDVAVKVLPEAFANDESRLMRFNREARALAALNHPNIASIYGVEEIPPRSATTSGSLALVMELVEGEDLSARLARGPLPPDVALPIARQIARALEGAHSQGIVHRDLKPANIKLRADGTVKVLDFGLAKVAPAHAGTHAGLPDTQPGDAAVMGTPGYMSPEQIRGQKVDWRSDLFAFGVVLYEMLSGRRAFAKVSGAETMSATLTETLPDLSTVAPRTDPAVAAAVARCLEKEPQERFQSAKELAFALETVNAYTAARSSIQWQPGKWLLAAGVVVFVGLSVVEVRRTLLNAPAPATYRQVTSDGQSLSGDLSPDGETLAYVLADGPLGRRLMIRDLSGGPAAQIYRAEDGGIAVPRWSHSGRQIAVRTGSELVVLSRFGGAPTRIPFGETASRLTWSPDDSELIISGLPRNWFWVVSLQTRQIRRVEMKAGFGGEVADLSPDGDRFLLFAWQAPDTGVWSMRRDGSDLRQHVSEKRRTRDARWAETGDSFYYLVVGANLSEIRRARVLGDGPDPSPIVVQGNLTIQDSSQASFSISRNGRLAYPRVSFDRNLWRADVSPLRSSSDPIPLRAVTSGTSSGFPQFSPDGARIAFAHRDGELGQILLASTEGKVERTLVSGPGHALEPAWSPDGESLAYVLEDDSGRHLHVVDVSSGVDRALGVVAAPTYLEWAPGRNILYRPPNWWVHSLNPSTGEDAPLVERQEGSSLFSPRYSSAGDRVALYLFDKKGPIGLASVSLSDRRLRMIPGTNHLLRPVGWSADDRFIYAVDENTATLVAVSVDGKGGTRTMGALPSRKMYGQAVEGRGTLKLVFFYTNDRSDIWVVDNFDAGRR